MTDRYGMYSGKKQGMRPDSHGADNCYGNSKGSLVPPRRIKNDFVELQPRLRTYNRYRGQPTESERSFKVEDRTCQRQLIQKSKKQV